MQLLWVILRKTYGWHKKEDEIALSQFSDMTGISKPHVIRYLKKLLHKKVIAIAQKGNGTTKYSINKDFDTWEPLPKKATLHKKAINVAQKGNASLPKKVPTKETTTKEKKESSRRTLSDDEWYAYLRSSPAYSGIDIDLQKAKCEAWCVTNGKLFSRRRLQNWLNKTEKPLKSTGGKIW
jgi:phage replication O-like protein O